jgi:hypothetical protein
MPKGYPKTPRPSFAERFASHVDHIGPVPPHKPELGPCWVWQACRNAAGYGETWLPGHGSQLAHRVAWLLEYGQWPQPCALHHCDNPACVRPSHLFEGTRRDNNDDKMRKGRHPSLRPGADYWAKGERHGRHKLTEAEARTILAECGRDIASRRIYGARYGVSPGTIYDLVAGLTWPHLPRKQ